MKYKKILEEVKRQKESCISMILNACLNSTAAGLIGKDIPKLQCELLSCFMELVEKNLNDLEIELGVTDFLQLFSLYDKWYNGNTDEIDMDELPEEVNLYKTDRIDFSFKEV